MTKKLSLFLLASLLILWALPPDLAAKKTKKEAAKEDLYAGYVWPPPPDQARIKLEAIISGRPDVEAGSKLRRALIGASPKSPYDMLKKPYAVEFDLQGRVLVTDSQTGALLRFDREGARMDIFGTQGPTRLKLPLGMDVGADGTIYVADAGQAKVIAFSPEGDVTALLGRAGELVNPTDAAISPDGDELWVADSKAHQIVIFDLDSGSLERRLGKSGAGPGEFNHPTSLAFGPEGDLFVVDQINSRIQVFDRQGEFLDQFGQQGVGFGSFVRPKDVAVDEVGLIYITDNAFNNFQLFDADYSLLTFVGEGGATPGRFHGASGIAVHGDEIAVVDQLGHRLQIFRFILPRSGE